MKPPTETMKAPDLFIEGEYLLFDKKTGELITYGHKERETAPEEPEDPNQIKLEL